MLELRLFQGSLILLKKVLESVDGLFADANFDWSPSGLAFQAMDSSLKALVVVLLSSEGFDRYQCDSSLSMGINLNNMAKMLDGAQKDEIVTLKADRGGHSVTCMFESPPQGKTDFEMNLIGSQHLGIPEAEYHHAVVTMPSAEFAWICKLLSSIGDTVVISVTSQVLKFSTKGDIGAANIVCRQNTTVKPGNSTIIEMNEPVSLTVTMTSLNSFTKATALSDTVTICLTSELPVVVEYKIDEMGYIRFYVASKIQDDDEDDEGTT